MKLIISASPIRIAKLIVVNGDNVISQKEVWYGEIENTINYIFKNYYIEAVEFIEKNKYNEKLIDYITKTYKGVEIL